MITSIIISHTHAPLQLCIVASLLCSPSANCDFQQFHSTCSHTFTPVQLCTFLNFWENFICLVSLLFLLSPELNLHYNCSQLLYSLFSAHVVCFFCETIIYILYSSKSSLGRVSNAVCGCIDNIYCELCHESAMNIILRFRAKYVLWIISYRKYSLCIYNYKHTKPCVSASTHYSLLSPTPWKTLKS